jgi:hypothetical protein
MRSCDLDCVGGEAPNRRKVISNTLSSANNTGIVGACSTSTLGIRLATQWGGPKGRLSEAM